MDKQKIELCFIDKSIFIAYASESNQVTVLNSLKADEHSECLLANYHENKYLMHAYGKICCIYDTTTLKMLYKCTYPKKMSAIACTDNAILYADRYGDVYQIPFNKITMDTIDEKIPTEEYKYGLDEKHYVSSLVFGHQETIDHLLVTPKKDFIVTIDYANKIKITKVDTPYVIQTILFAKKKIIFSKMIGNYELLVINEDGTASLWDILSDACYDFHCFSLPLPKIKAYIDKHGLPHIVLGQKLHTINKMDGKWKHVSEVAINGVIVDVIENGIVIKIDNKYELLN